MTDISDERLHELVGRVTRWRSRQEAVTDEPYYLLGDCLLLLGWQADEVLRLHARVEQLEDGARKWASECAECNGSGQVTVGFDAETDLYVYGPCPECADIRALLEEP